MAFERGKALIEKVNDAEFAQQYVSECADYLEEDDLEAAEDEAYKRYWNALQELAEYLSVTVVGIDKRTAWDMAKNKRDEMLNLFNRAK